MRSLLLCSVVWTSIACSKQESTPATRSEATKPEATKPEATTPPDASEPDAATEDPAAEVAKLVVEAVGSKALGSQVIDASCVAVSIVPAGDWTIAAARLNECGDKTARSIVWLFKRGKGAWNEDYAGKPPKCWKGVPPDIARAVTIATKIPAC